MSYLSYQEAFDAYHTIFRLSRFKLMCDRPQPIYVDHWRIVDFFMLFPSRLQRIRVKKEHSHFRPLIRRLAGLSSYEEHPDDVVLLRRMDAIQRAALFTMAAEGHVDPTKLTLDQIEFTPKELPETIVSSASLRNESDAESSDFLRLLATEYTFGGTDGIKARTGLLEHRYDVA